MYLFLKAGSNKKGGTEMSHVMCVGVVCWMCLSVCVLKVKRNVKLLTYMKRTQNNTVHAEEDVIFSEPDKYTKNK